MNIWDIIILQPILNILIMLCNFLFDNFGLTIIVLTIIVNLLMLPLTLKQLRATGAMQSLQPKLAELQKKYGKDKQKMAQEQMRLYRESGMSPMGCMVPMLIQMPIWIALYQSIMLSLAVTPEGLLNISRYFYPWPALYAMLPLDNHFLWLNLATGDVFLAILVGGTMWLQQKMSMTSSGDPRQQAQGKMMLWIMPLMFAFLTLSFPSGLALYWVTSNVIRIAMQYYVTGWGTLLPSKTARPSSSDRKLKSRIAQVEQSSSKGDYTKADIVEPSSIQKEGTGYEISGGERQINRGSDSARSREIRPQSGRDRGQHRKRK